MDERGKSGTSWRHLSAPLATAGVLVLVGVLGIGRLWDDGPTAGFVLLVVTVGSIEFAVIRRTFDRSWAEAGPQPVTLASWVTIGRTSAIALLAGFLLTVPPAGNLEWLPAILFGIAAGLDAVDGPLARATGSVSRFGEQLDEIVDSVTVLVGAVVVVLLDLAHPAFLAVGLAWYVFVGGIYYRRYRSSPVYELDSTLLRRVLGAMVMGMIFVVLLPPVDPATATIFTSAVALPFLLNFLRDWLVVSGRLDRGTARRR